VVELKPVVQKPARRVTQADIDWLDAHRVGKKEPLDDAGALLSRMRDEDWQ
jgi:hypothetical protein